MPLSCLNVLWLVSNFYVILTKWKSHFKLRTLSNIRAGTAPPGLMLGKNAGVILKKSCHKAGPKRYTDIRLQWGNVTLSVAGLPNQQMLFHSNFRTTTFVSPIRFGSFRLADTQSPSNWPCVTIELWGRQPNHSLPSIQMELSQQQ